MYQGKIIFSQIMDHLPIHTFRRKVQQKKQNERYIGCGNGGRSYESALFYVYLKKYSPQITCLRAFTCLPRQQRR